MDMHEAVTTPVVVKTANAITYAAAGGAFAFGMTASEVGVLASIMIGVCTLAIGQFMNYHFKTKHYKLVEKYILSGQVDRRKDTDPRREYEPMTSPCTHCPLIKHRHDFDPA